MTSKNDLRGKALKTTSKFLSLVLRHNPESIGLTLDPQGWASVDMLISLAGASGTELTTDIIREVVATSDKQRFALSSDGLRIRANQGHSVPVELNLPAIAPPEILFHGTTPKFVPSIEREGLLPGLRNHVHLSSDNETAVRVGSRHGKPIVLQVRAQVMFSAGFVFFRSENGVWLTTNVPPEFIRFRET
jgi:putative RNA 2'-phosphotransferase